MIDDPGLYILDRDWQVAGFGATGRVLLSIRADNVTLDMQGFEIRITTADERDDVVHIGGRNVTLRNGRISLSRGVSIQTSGDNTLVEGMRVTLPNEPTPRTAVMIGGKGSTLTHSFVTGGKVSAFDSAVIRENVLILSGENFGLLASTRTVVVDNVLECNADPCIEINNGSLVARNTLREKGGTLWITGAGNFVIDNISIAGPPIVITGMTSGNTISGNR